MRIASEWFISTHTAFVNTSVTIGPKGLRNSLTSIETQTIPVERALEIVGKRWTLLILQNLLRGYRRFGEIKASIDGIASNILANRLKLLERHGVVERHFYSQHPPRAEYRLTRKGHELGVVAGALTAWGAKHLVDDMVLVHSSCGSRIGVEYRCPNCDVVVPGAGVRLVSNETAEPG